MSGLIRWRGSLPNLHQPHITIVLDTVSQGCADAERKCHGVLRMVTSKKTPTRVWDANYSLVSHKALRLGSWQGTKPSAQMMM